MAAAVLSSDVVGSTRLSERFSSQAYARITGRFIDEMTGAVERHKGEVGTQLGDGMIALFRAPDVPPEQRAAREARRAVQAALRIRIVAKTLNTTPDEIVARHVAGEYRVAMIGFTPGWSYLSGLDKSLHLPRRQNPRLVTPAGTISIGGLQSGIQCLAGPSGWHLLGRTPVRTYRLHRDPIFLLEPGDRITFFAIDAKLFAEQDNAAGRGEIIAELIAS